MKCIVCATDVADDAAQCPSCHDYVWPWRNLNGYAAKFLGEGAYYARQGDHVKATLRLAMAAVLNPEDVPTLRSLGQILAAQGDYDDASYYLTKCINLAGSRGLAPDPLAEAALSRIETLKATPPCPNVDPTSTPGS